MNLLEVVNRIKELRNDATALSNYIADLTGSDFEGSGYRIEQLDDETLIRLWDWIEWGTDYAPKM